MEAQPVRGGGALLSPIEKPIQPQRHKDTEKSLLGRARRTLSSADVITFLTLSILLLAFSNTFSAGIPSGMKIIPPRTPAHAEIGNSPRRDAAYHIAAIRVEFVRDTLSTTTGDGSFTYTPNDTMYFDPPPHDRDYFHDHLTFLQYYWGQMSDGNVDMAWDIFPDADQGAYQLPKQMWQYNYNYSDEQLDKGLAELFRDAVQAADNDVAIRWDEYDLVIFFHAGSGGEFDLGFTETPHDIPSAWMVKEDFEQQLALPDGILVVDNGDTSYVDGGLILPETETHDGVQISIAGVVCSLFGHWLGLPGLYDNDNGDPVVGKWSLMDRGFGNFFGSIPGELDAWSRVYKGWVQPTDITDEHWTITTRGFAQPDTTADTVRIGKVRISETEYYLVENRNRDPELDSVAIAYDRDDRIMVFTESYEIDTTRTDPNFRVPVRIDNLDFDAPGSGILIWHVDEGLYPLMVDKRFNSIDDRRGLDLEEADGAQDIGQNYPFLTPGYGTDYGVFEDAWYGDNEAHRNGNNFTVQFSDDTYPNSRANSGAYTHITMDRFAKRDTVMGFRYRKSYVQDGFPVEVAVTSTECFATGNFDQDPYDEIMLFSRDSTVKIIDGDGTILFNERNISLFKPNLHITTRIKPSVADINNDGKDDVVAYLNDQYDLWHVVAMMSNGNTYEFKQIDAIRLYTWPDTDADPIVIGGPPNDRKLFLSTATFGDMEYTILDKDFSIVGAFPASHGYNKIFTVGSVYSDTFLVVELDTSRVFHDNAELITFAQGHLELDAQVADFDASGQPDLMIVNSRDEESPSIKVFPDFIQNQFVVSKVLPLPYSFNGDFLPVDVDKDGQFEINGVWDSKVFGIKPNGIFASEMNVPTNRLSARDAQATIGQIFDPHGILPNLVYSYSSLRMAADLDGDGLTEYIHVDYDDYDLGASYALGSPDEYLQVLDKEGKPLLGFPIALDFTFHDYRLAQLDDDANLEFIYMSENRLNVIEIPATNPTIWWGSRYRDKQNRNAIWEPATPFTANANDALMPNDLCYAWPNPAKDGLTYFRYFLNFDADVKIDIFDITGRKIETLYGSGNAGEHSEITWNTAGIARGGYLAVVKANGNGQSGEKLVKVAVVK